MPEPATEWLANTGRHHLPPSIGPAKGYRSVSREVFHDWNRRYHQRQCDMERTGGEHRASGQHFRPESPAERFPPGMVYVGGLSGNVYRIRPLAAEGQHPKVLVRQAEQLPTWWGSGKHRICEHIHPTRWPSGNSSRCGICGLPTKATHA